MLLVGWCGMSMLCFAAQSCLAAMSWTHLVFRDGGVMIYVPCSKTDQGGQGNWVYVADAGGALNPVAALRCLPA